MSKMRKALKKDILFDYLKILRGWLVDAHFYAFFVFDKPSRRIEINYENNFSATLIKELIEEDINVVKINFISLG